MAELCRKCFIEIWHPTQEEIDNIVMSEDNDMCEGCMEWGSYVHHLGKDISCEEYDKFMSRVADEFIKLSDT